MQVSHIALSLFHPCMKMKKKGYSLILQGGAGMQLFIPVESLWTMEREFSQAKGNSWIFRVISLNCCNSGYNH